jgi:hypothetical protein
MNLLIMKLPLSYFYFQSGNFKYSLHHPHLITLNPNKIQSFWRWHDKCRHEAILLYFPGHPNKSQCFGNGFCFLIQVDRILWRVDLLLGNARNTHAANNRGAMFSVVRARTVAMQHTPGTFPRTPDVTQQWRGCVFCCGPCRVVIKNNRRCFIYGPRHAQC